MALRFPSKLLIILKYSDEADVFLEARDKSEMERNALVSGDSTHFEVVIQLVLTVPTSLAPCYGVL